MSIAPLGISAIAASSSKSTSHKMAFDTLPPRSRSALPVPTGAAPTRSAAAVEEAFGRPRPRPWWSWTWPWTLGSRRRAADPPLQPDQSLRRRPSRPVPRRRSLATPHGSVVNTSLRLPFVWQRAIALLATKTRRRRRELQVSADSVSSGAQRRPVSQSARAGTPRSRAALPAARRRVPRAPPAARRTAPARACSAVAAVGGRGPRREAVAAARG